MIGFLTILVANIVLCGVISLWVASKPNEGGEHLLYGGILIGLIFGSWNGIVVALLL